MAELWAVLLAAGASRRLGRAKQLIKIDGEALVHRSARLALEACESCLVVLGCGADAVEDALSGLPVAVSRNMAWADGMGGSIAWGVKQLPATARGALILPCDLPAMKAGELAALVAEWRARPDRIVASRYGEVKGIPVIFPQQWFERLAGLKGDHGAGALLASESSIHAVDFPSAASDLDCPGDLEGITR